MKISEAGADGVIKFDTPLMEGTILSRPNRFVVHVKDERGEELRVHCPATGSIGGIRLDGLPCLISRAEEGSKRSTQYTLEAIAMERKSPMEWIGVNQNMANRYIEALLRGNLLPIPTLSSVKTLKREPTLGSNRLDFLVNGNIYVEVKTPVKNLQVEIPEGVEVLTTAATGTTRMLSQVREITKELRGERGSKAVLITLFMYDNPGFVVPSGHNAIYSETGLALADSAEAGLERWQVNLEFGVDSVRLDRVLPIT